MTGPEGRVAFAVLTYWISDDTQKRVAVPFSVLSCEEQNCVLNASKDTLDSAPSFVSEDDLVESKLAEDIYRYFGVQLYWSRGRDREVEEGGSCFGPHIFQEIPIDRRLS